MDSWRAGLTAMFVMLDVIALTLNLVILIIILKMEHLRRTLGNIFVINIMCADLLVTLIVIPMWIINFAESYWILPEYACDIYGYMNAVLSYDTIWTTCLISCERYYSIAYPMLHAVNMTLPRSLVATASTWILAGFCAVLPTIYHENSKEVYQVLGPLCVNSYSSADDYDVHWILIGVVCYCIPAIILITTYFAIFRIARQVKTQVTPKIHESIVNSEVSILPYNQSIWPSLQMTVNAPSPPNDQAPSHQINSNSTRIIVIDGSGDQPVTKPTVPTTITKSVGVGKAARTVIFISGLFICLWLPYYVTVFYGSVHATFNNRSTAEIVAAWMAFLTYLANPIVYGHFNQPIRCEFKRCLYGRFKKEHPDKLASDQPDRNENFLQFLERTSSPELSQGTDKF